MRYIVINEYDIVLNKSSDRYVAKQLAEDWVRRNPGNKAFVFEWVTGYETTVMSREMFSPPEMPPEPIEPVHPAVIDALTGESDGN